MSLENIRKTIAQKQSDAERANPTVCEDCPNLRSGRTVLGQSFLYCMLEQNGAELAGTVDEGKTKYSPTVWHVARALLSEDLGSFDEDGSARDFVERAETANGGCPIIEGITDLIAHSEAGVLVDFTPPSPLLTSAEIDHANGASQAHLGHFDARDIT